TPEEESLTSAIAGLGAVTISNSELSSLTRSRSQELEQLMQIICDLDRGDHPEHIMQQFVDAASQFLGFERALVGTLEEAGFKVRWHHGGNTGGRLDAVLANEIVSQALLTKEVFWTDNRAGASGPAAEVITKFQIRQLLAIPLLGTDGEVIGVFGALDRSDGLDISQEDIRRGRALAVQAATWLRMSHHVTVSDQYRARAESLMALAQELSSLLRLPDFGKGFVNRAAKMLGATAGALTVKQDSGLETVILQSLGGEGEPERSLLGEFDRAVAEVLTRHPQSIVSGNAAELLGTKLAQSLGWTDCTLVRLSGITSELVGVLALAGRGKELGAADRQLLQAIAGNASVALENAQFFTRMEQANRHWMEIFDAIGDFIVAHDESRRVLRVNRSLADFIGVQPNELVGVNMSALLALGEDSLLRSCPFCRSTGEAAGEYVHPVLERTFLVSTSRVHGASSEILQTIHVLKDISDRREAERRYRELFDNIQEGLFFSTPDGRFIEVNDALVRMLGYSSREELLHVDVRSEMYSSPERHLELSAHMLQHGALRNHEEVLRRKDGNPVHVLINAFAVCDTHGRVMQYRGLMLDITGLKSSQSQLLLERDFSEKIVNNTQSLILVADTDGLVTYANRRWYDMGYEQKRILGQRLDGLVVPSRRGVLNEAFTAILKGNQVDNLDLQILRGDGRVGHFSVNLSPMRDEAGNVTSIVVVMSDITDAATLQAKLMHAEKMAAVGQLVSGVAHEVNNPLTAILGFADLLMENSEVPESARKDLRVILQEAQRTKQIVQNLLSFARQMPPQRKPVQLNVILRRTVQLRAYDFHSRGVEVIQQFDQDLPNVIGDSHQLQQVFLNIVNNAYDAVREAMRPARIEITTEARGNFVEISFRDNGNGITFPDRIFDPFFTTKEVGKGTGLGLSICYGIVREHGGEVLCHNNVGGEGATFIVRLPVATELASIGAAAGVTQP
ncbi:MAG: PAS domain S-box protein, partial [Acidobacteriales bacterium]|nr:PAS domain S-box protein [Terriglobales bacterium]